MYQLMALSSRSRKGAKYKLIRAELTFGWFPAGPPGFGENPKGIDIDESQRTTTNLR
jgi:hypothetical protein